MFHNMMMSSIIQNIYNSIIMLYATEFRSDVLSVRLKYNQTDLKIINILNWCEINVKLNQFRIYMTIVQFLNHSSIPTVHNQLHQLNFK